ncbi:rRNA-binding ribosome biosynthesis protein [Coemansia sp. RSA 1365]|nr:rRNA-binding ribosome biosynthesis protein [Coemansia sp. RSA 1365]
MGHGRRKKRTHAVPTQEELEKVPRSLVVKSGLVGQAVSELVSDVRRVMEPNTASRLRERKTNKIRDYVAVSSQLGLSHMLLFSQTATGTNLRIGRFPRGPTLYFRVNKYSLASDCLSLQKTPHTSAAEYNTSPLIILNNFAGENRGNELKLMTAMLQNMFPSINPSSMRLSEARRVVLFNYNEETGMVDFRHYTIVVKPVGVTKGVKRVIMSKNMPSLAQFDDISDYVLREAFASESDIEDGPENSVTLAQDYVGRNNTKDQQRAIRLMELGPRMELRLLKIEGGLCEGEVIHHSYVHKTKEEVEQTEKMRQANLSRLAQRRQQQQENVDRKKQEKKESMSKSKTKEESDMEENGSDQDVENSHSDSEKPAKPEKVRLAADDFGADNYDDDLIEDSQESDSAMAVDSDAEENAVETSRQPKRAKTMKKKKR